MSTGVGGPLVLADDARIVDWAVFYLRYSAFLPSQLPDGPVAGEIAGDNAAYTRASLARHTSSLTDGFWEVEFHRRLRADGGNLEATTQATASFTPILSVLVHRLPPVRPRPPLWRVPRGAGLEPRCGSSELPRWSRRSSPGERPDAPAQERQHRRRFLLALPLLFALAAAWAAGEARGALTRSAFDRLVQRGTCLEKLRP